MFILRLDYDTGLRVDLGFRDRERCMQARNSIDKAKDGKVLVVDDHGHEISVRVERILVSSVVDVKMERYGQIEVGVAIEKGAAEAIDDFELVPPEPVRMPPVVHTDRVPLALERQPEYADEAPRRPAPRFSG